MKTRKIKYRNWGFTADAEREVGVELEEDLKRAEKINLPKCHKMITSTATMVAHPPAPWISHVDDEENDDPYSNIFIFPQISWRNLQTHNLTFSTLRLLLQSNIYTSYIHILLLASEYCRLARSHPYLLIDFHNHIKFLNNYFKN